MARAPWGRSRRGAAHRRSAKNAASAADDVAVDGPARAPAGRERQRRRRARTDLEVAHDVEGGRGSTDDRRPLGSNRGSDPTGGPSSSQRSSLRKYFRCHSALT